MLRGTVRLLKFRRTKLDIVIGKYKLILLSICLVYADILGHIARNTSTFDLEGN